jgi:hypothetical protein
VGGKRAAPPEDCGGAWGYQDLLEILKNKQHPDHEDMKSWVGISYDPDRMNIQMVKMAPKKIEEMYGPSFPI